MQQTAQRPAANTLTHTRISAYNTRREKKHKEHLGLHVYQDHLVRRIRVEVKLKTGMNFQHSGNRIESCTCFTKASGKLAQEERERENDVCLAHAACDQNVAIEIQSQA